MFSQKLFMIPLLIWGTGCAGKSEASTPPKQVSLPSVYELNLANETWRVDVNLQKSAFKIQRSTSQKCEEWNVARIDESTSSVEVTKNQDVIAFRPLVSGEPCDSDFSKNIWARVNAENTKLIKDRAFPSVSSKFGLQTTSELWEYPYDYVTIYGFYSISPMIKVSDHQTVGITIGTANLEYLKKQTEESKRLPAGLSPNVCPDLKPDSNLMSLVEIKNQNSSERRGLLYGYLCSQADSKSGQFEEADAINTIKSILTKWQFESRFSNNGENK
jgi:hypothetical protein